MRILIIENDFRIKHKLWKLICLNHGSIDMDFKSGTIHEDGANDEENEEFTAIEIILKDPIDAHKLEKVLEYQLEFEDESTKKLQKELVCND